MSVLQRKLWQLCREICKVNYPNSCYTCSQTGLTGANFQLGHLWPKAALGAFLKYDMRVIRWQCFRCNIHLGGNGAVFYERMLQEIGPEKMAQLQKDRQVTVKSYDHYTKLLDDYTLLLDQMKYNDKGYL
ncbi:MAG TPA: recombination protein NinG [Waddliaceae bacterium]